MSSLKSGKASWAAAFGEGVAGATGARAAISGRWSMDLMTKTARRWIHNSNQWISMVYTSTLSSVDQVCLLHAMATTSGSAGIVAHEVRGI